MKPDVRYCFGYGSNMWDEQMRKRCPGSRKAGFGRLRGYRWIISTRGYANVVESAEDEVEGVLFTLSPEDEAALDRFENVAAGSYRKENLPVWIDGREVTALVYVDPITHEGPPKPEYILRINAGLADAGLSADYVAKQIRKFIPA